ncbi:MAG: hypothetical protein H0V17_18280 [Deltaproteobacteria bacterium]|nr:hypothetical protein [Deltaproteobacteria bacterium]
MRIAIVRGPDDSVRAPDDHERLASEEARRVDLRDAALAAGHQISELADCEVAIVMLTHDSAGFTTQLGVRCIAAVHTRAPYLDDDESDRSVLGTRADAFVLGGRWLAGAIAWVISEDSAARTSGQPRLVVIGTCRGDFGMIRTIPEEPLIIGRAMSFGEHPQRPDRLSTPSGRIARWHARVRNLAGVIEIADMASTNGTLVIRHGSPTRLLVPQQRQTGHDDNPASSAWLVRDADEWTALRVGDEVQLPGFWRFRLDGDPAWRPDD